MKKIGIIGVGNPLRADDGIGILLIEELSKREIPEGMDLIDGGIIGMSIVHDLAKFHLVVILDAVDFGGRCGETRLFSVEDIESLNLSTSAHELDLLEMIKLSKELGEVPDKIFIFGVQPGDLSLKIGISREIEIERISMKLYDMIMKMI